MWQWMMFAAAAAAQVGGATSADPQVPALAETLGYRTDSADRMTVPITIGNRGPFRFVIDTGSERTVISRELAERLSLDPSRRVVLVSVADVRSVDTVLIPELDLGRRSISRVHAPALEARHLGAEGILGVDSLRNQRVVFDFERQELRLSRSAPRDEPVPENTIVVRAQTRLGRLVVADATVDGERVRAIVDTGSQVTVGNEALLRRLASRGRIDPTMRMEITSVTGVTVNVNYMNTRRLGVGSARIVNLPIAFAGLELFRQLGLEERPAILLGMDVLKLFRRVSIDFGSRRLRLEPGPVGNLQAAPLRVAAAR